MTAATPTDSATEAQVAAAIARCAAGEKAALRVIYDIEAQRMVGVARRMLRRQDLAEEAVQDAFMRVWRSARTFDPQKGAARSWLYAILRSVVHLFVRLIVLLSSLTTGGHCGAAAEQSTRAWICSTRSCGTRLTRTT